MGFSYYQCISATFSKESSNFSTRVSNPPFHYWQVVPVPSHGVLISRCWIRYTSLRNFNFHKTSVTYKGLGHYHKAPALGYRHETLGTVHKKKGRQNVWSTIIIKPSGPYICFGYWIDKLPNGSLQSFQTSLWTSSPASSLWAWLPFYKVLN